VARECQYVHTEQIEDSGTDGWECSQEVAEESTDRCLFHLPKEDREQVEEDRVAEKFLQCTNSAGKQSKELIGAEIDILRVNFQHVDAPDNYPIDLRFASIEEIEAQHAEISQPVRLTGATVGTADFSHSTFDSPLELTSSSISSLTCEQTHFEAHLSGRNAELVGVRFDDAIFEEGVDFKRSHVYVGASFQSAKFNGVAEFTHASFESPYTNLDERNSKEEYWLEHHLSLGPLMGVRRAVDQEKLREFPTPRTQENERLQLYFSERAFVDDNFTHINDIHLNGGDFRDTSFLERAVFDSAKLDYADFGNAKFASRASFVSTQIYGTIYFHATSFTEAQLQFAPLKLGRRVEFADAGGHEQPDSDKRARVYLRASSIKGGRVQQPDAGKIYYDVSHARVGDIDIISEANVFNHLVVRRTDFDGFDFTEYREDSENKNWLIDNTSASVLEAKVPRDKEDREVTYLKAKQGAAEVGDTLAESKFFQQEMYFRGFRYRIDPTEDSLVREFSSIAKIAGNRLYGITCGYGEKPHRVILSYCVLVSVIASMIMSPYLAIGEFALFLRGVQQVGFMLATGDAGSAPGWFASVVGAFRTFIIPAFIALLLFTFSRSIER
jgi:uncharacterized protein YjbI with pentapeptide repeats